MNRRGQDRVEPAASTGGLAVHVGLPRRPEQEGSAFGPVVVSKYAVKYGIRSPAEECRKSSRWARVEPDEKMPTRRWSACQRHRATGTSGRTSPTRSPRACPSSQMRPCSSLSPVDLRSRSTDDKRDKRGRWSTEAPFYQTLAEGFARCSPVAQTSNRAQRGARRERHRCVRRTH